MSLPPGSFHGDTPQYRKRLQKWLAAQEDEKPTVSVEGVSDAGVGTDVTLAFRAGRATPHVTVQVQSVSTGGEAYNPNTFVSQTQYNTQSQKRFTQTISRDDDEKYYAYLIPEAQLPQGCNEPFIKFDGTGETEDYTAFADLGKRTTGTAELEDAAVDTAKLANLAVTAQKMTESGRGFVMDVDFTPTDNDTVTWGTGTLILADGTSHSIGSGTTGNMTAATYVYFDPSVSTTAFQTTTTLASATGERRVLIGVAFPASDATQNARFISSRQVAVNEEDISVNSITTDLLVAGAVTAAKMSVAKLDEIADDVGIIVDGELRNAAGTRFLDLNATGSEPFLKHENFELLADGTADFGGTVSSDRFTAVEAFFDGSIWSGRNPSPSAGDQAVSQGDNRVAFRTFDGSSWAIQANIFHDETNNLLVYSTAGVGDDHRFSGGSVIVGSDPGGSEALRVGGGARFQPGSINPKVLEAASDALALRTVTNPASGASIFEVRSSGQSRRLYVEHDGVVGTTNSHFETPAGKLQAVVHHGTGSAASVGTEGTLHTEDL